MSEGKVYTMHDVCNPVKESIIKEALDSPTLVADMRDAKFLPNIFQVEGGLPFGSARVVQDGAKQYGWFIRDIQIELADLVVFTPDSGYDGPTHKLTRGLTTCHPAGTTIMMGYVPYIVAEISDTERLFAFYHKESECMAMVLAPELSLDRKAKQIIANLGKMHTFSKTCSCCGASSQQLRCCPCKAVQYCDADCQKRHWKAHKKQCTA